MMRQLDSTQNPTVMMSDSLKGIIDEDRDTVNEQVAAELGEKCIYVLLHVKSTITVSSPIVGEDSRVITGILSAILVVDDGQYPASVATLKIDARVPIDEATSLLGGALVDRVELHRGEVSVLDLTDFKSTEVGINDINAANETCTLMLTLRSL